MSDGFVPSINRFVVFVADHNFAESVNRMIDHASGKMANTVRAGDEFPLLIIRSWDASPEQRVNGQIFLDGNFQVWATSIKRGDTPGTWHPTPYIPQK